MARKLSIRKTEAGFLVGPQGHGPTVAVRASDKRDALRKGKEALRESGQFEKAEAASFRCYMRRGQRKGGDVAVVMDTRREAI